MKKAYKKPELKKINIDNHISLVMMTNEGTPPGGPFSQYNNIKRSPTNNPYTV